jgi:hypothetical protein
VLGVALGVALGCATTRAPVLGQADLQLAVDELRRPLPGDLAALYRLRVPSSGGLRLAIVTRGEAGRLTVSEPFGAAVSISAWSPGQAPSFFDLREGCRVDAVDLSAALGVGGIPMGQAARLLGGRLPALADDRVQVGADGWVRVAGSGWGCRVRIAAEPWRVEEVAGASWRVRLAEHTGSLPGFVRLERDGQGAVELRLVRLEWPESPALPEVPELPPCPAG